MTDPAAAPVPSSAPAPASRPGRVLGIVGLVLAIVWPLQLLGLILSIVALVQSKRAGLKNGPAVAGIIVSIVLLVVSVLITVLFWNVLTGVASACADLGPGVHEVDGITYTCN